MKLHRQCKIKLVAFTLVFSLAFLAVSVRRAHAYNQGAFAAGVIAVWVTYFTVKGLVCTPVAALNASKSNAGFGGAFKECWDWKPDLVQPGEDLNTTVSDERATATNSEPGEQLELSDVNAVEHSLDEEEPK
jgi:hypothetical protein